MRSELYGSLFTQEALAALLPSDWVVADLGCGTGPLAVALAPHVARVIGIDASPAMLKAARRAAASFPNVDLHEGRLEALPLADEACDAPPLLLGASCAPHRP